MYTCLEYFNSEVILWGLVARLLKTWRASKPMAFFPAYRRSRLRMVFPSRILHDALVTEDGAKLPLIATLASFESYSAFELLLRQRRVGKDR